MKGHFEVRRQSEATTALWILPLLLVDGRGEGLRRLLDPHPNPLPKEREQGNNK